MIDVHCHLNFKSFNEDLDEVVERARADGVRLIVNVGTSLDSSRKAVEIAQKYQDCYAIVGVHPHHADKVENGWIEELEKIAKSNKVIGIGEIGLDYYSYKSNGIVDPKLQKELFEKQIQLSIKLNLPIQIHNRHAGEDVIGILKKYKGRLRDIPGMFHCFAGSKEVLKDALDLGFYIGFDGNITYKGLASGESVALSELAKLTPVNRIFAETDSPFLTPEPLRGIRNEPKNVIILGKYIAGLKQIEFGEFQENIYLNFNSVFGIKIS